MSHVLQSHWLTFCVLSSFQKSATRQFLSGARRFTLLRRLSFLTASPRVTRLMEGVASLSLLLGPRYIVHSQPCPLPLLSIPFPPYRPRVSSNSLPSPIRYFLSLFRFLACSFFISTMSSSSSLEKEIDEYQDDTSDSGESS